MNHICFRKIVINCQKSKNNKRDQEKDIFKFLYHYMLWGVETPSIDIAFFITIPNACKRANLE